MRLRQAQISFLTLFIALLLGTPQTAYSERQSGIRGWVNPGYSAEDLVRPYLKDGKKPHAYLWGEEDWSPEDWITADQDAKSVIQDLYKGGIISDQSADNGIPVLEVGYTFMALSSAQRLRVVQFLDYVYGITADNKDGVMHIEHEDTNKRIGLYTIHGLQLQ